jgi:hypothetical protein
MLCYLALPKWYSFWPKNYELPFAGYLFGYTLALYMDYSAEACRAGYGLSFMPTLGTSSTGVFFPGSWVAV